MKVDVVIDFYRKWREWPMVAWGLAHNKECVNRVIVVNDELWDDEGRASIRAALDSDIPLLLLDHPHNGFGGHRCFNQGVDAVETPWFCAINADIVLAPGSLAMTCAHADEQLIIYEWTHDVPRDVTLADFPNPPIEREDWRIAKHSWPVFFDFRFTYIVAHTESHHAIGGANHDLVEYGGMDYDYGCRWALKYGESSFMVGAGGCAYHIGGKDRPEDKVGKPTGRGNKPFIIDSIRAFGNMMGFEVIDDECT